MKDMYDVILKRKSVRQYRDELVFTESELDAIREQFSKLVPLDGSIRTCFEIVPVEETDAKFGKYCVNMYSEKKELYLMNAGYMLQQLDFYFASNNIGSCWYGMGTPKELEKDGLSFVIMMAFGKSLEEDFRHDLSEFKRRDEADIWHGEFDGDVKLAARLSPSAKNTQPWLFESSGGRIIQYRDTQPQGAEPGSRTQTYFNQIDNGIVMCCLETGLSHKSMDFERKIINEKGDGRYWKMAEFTIK
mgnify:CR=1 FL=1